MVEVIVERLDEKFAEIENRLAALERDEPTDEPADEESVAAKVEGRRLQGTKLRFPAASNVMFTDLPDEEISE